MPGTRWSSHKDVAAKALRKLAGPHVPASLTKLEQAVKRAHSAYDKAETAAREQDRAERQAVEATPDERPVDEQLAEDLADVA
jgi:predicted ribosome quality control (RQC) complex YloA/Tae2 family protein